MKKYFTVSHFVLIVIIIILAVLNIKGNIFDCGYKPGKKDFSQKIEFDFKRITQAINFSSEQQKIAESVKNELIQSGKKQRDIMKNMTNEFINIFERDSFDTSVLIENHNKTQELNKEQFNAIIDKFNELHSSLSPRQRQELSEIFRKKFEKKNKTENINK